MSIKIFDNGGKTIDRYLALIDGQAFSFSADALSPQGVNMYVGEASEIDKTALGSIISLRDLPKPVQTAIELRKK